MEQVKVIVAKYAVIYYTPSAMVLIKLERTPKIAFTDVYNNRYLCRLPVYV